MRHAAIVGRRSVRAAEDLVQQLYDEVEAVGGDIVAASLVDPPTAPVAAT